jgi:hypothetical protein
MKRVIALVFVVAVLLPTVFATTAGAATGGTPGSNCKADPHGAAHGYMAGQCFILG